MNMIVKVQSSVNSSDGLTHCLVYNKTRAIFYETAEEEEVKAVLEKLRGRPKAYFSAKLKKKPDAQGEKIVEILEEAATQDW